MATATSIETSAEGAAGGGSRSGPLRVLVVDEALPFPPDSGKRLRTWHLLSRLARRHQVELLCYADLGDPGQGAAQAALAAAGIACHTLPPPPERHGAGLYAALAANCFSPWPYSVAKHHTRRFQAALLDLCRQRRFDLLQVEWTPYASHLPHAAGGLPPHLIASHNIEADIWRRRAAVAGSWAARLYFQTQAAKMRRFERAAFRRARHVATVSDSDRRTALAWGAPRAAVVANGVDLDYFQPGAGAVAAERLLFVGALDWFPNQDALGYFADAILPLVHARRPQARLQVVGRRPPEGLRRRLAAAPGVELVGEVADVRPLLAAAAAVVVPLRIGGGSRIKIIEALAMEKAVIATGIGAEGLDLVAGEHLLIADTPAEFAAAAARLLAEPACAAQLGRAGGRWVRARHSWDDGARALEAAWRSAAAGGKG